MMAQLLTSGDNENIGVIAGKLRKHIGIYNLIDYKFIEIKDTAPVITIIRINITIEYKSIKYNTDISVSLEHLVSRTNRMPVLRNENGGQWLLFERSIYDLENIVEKVKIEETRKKNKK